MVDFITIEIEQFGISFCKWRKINIINTNNRKKNTCQETRQKTLLKDKTTYTRIIKNKIKIEGKVSAMAGLRFWWRFQLKSTREWLQVAILRSESTNRIDRLWDGACAVEVWLKSDSSHRCSGGVAEIGVKSFV